jgi:hypothetical protein
VSDEQVIGRFGHPGCRFSGRPFVLAVRTVDLYVWTSCSRIDRPSPDKPTRPAEPGPNLRTRSMESSDLFSHPYKPEASSDADHNSEPVQNPAFSDDPQSAATRPPS